MFMKIFHFRIVIEAESVFVHENFDYDTFDNDISMIKLTKKVNLDIYTPVCLPSSYDLNQENLNVWITGKVVCI